MERPDILSAKNIFSLYIDRARSTSIWNAADRAIKYTRRFFFITKLLRFAAAVITFVQTSAMLIASATLILTLLPLVLIVVLAAGISGWFCENRIRRKYPPPKDGSIYVLLPPDRELLEKHGERSRNNRQTPEKARQTHLPRSPRPRPLILRNRIRRRFRAGIPVQRSCSRSLPGERRERRHLSQQTVIPHECARNTSTKRRNG